MWAYRYDMRGKDLWLHLLMLMRDSPPRAPPLHEAGAAVEDPHYFLRDTNASDGDPSGGKATAWVDWPLCRAGIRVVGVEIRSSQMLVLSRARSMRRALPC